MIDPTHQGTSAAHLAALEQAIPEAAFVSQPAVELTVRGFRFTPDMLPGWNPGRARMVETPRGVRLAQLSIAEAATGHMARLEVMEAPSAEAARPLFLETLARFQIGAADAILSPPPAGEAMAAHGDRALVFLRGNLVIAAASLGPEPAPLMAIARTLDVALTSEPDTGDVIAPEHVALATRRVAAPAGGTIVAATEGARAGAPMFKILRHRGQPGAPQSCFAIAPDGTAQRVAERAVLAGQDGEA